MSHYTVRGSRVNVVRVFRAAGHKFHLHRPVERNGQRRRQGWQLSHAGVPVVALVDCDQETASAAIAAAIQAVSPTKAEVAEAVALVAAEDARGVDPTPRPF